MQRALLEPRTAQHAPAVVLHVRHAHEHVADKSDTGVRRQQPEPTGPQVAVAAAADVDRRTTVESAVGVAGQEALAHVQTVGELRVRPGHAVQREPPEAQGKRKTAVARAHRSDGNGTGQRRQGGDRRDGRRGDRRRRRFAGSGQVDVRALQQGVLQRVGVESPLRGSAQRPGAVRLSREVRQANQMRNRKERHRADRRVVDVGVHDYDADGQDQLAHRRRLRENGKRPGRRDAGGRFRLHVERGRVVGRRTVRRRKHVRSAAQHPDVGRPTPERNAGRV